MAEGDRSHRFGDVRFVEVDDDVRIGTLDLPKIFINSQNEIIKSVLRLYLVSAGQDDLGRS